MTDRDPIDLPFDDDDERAEAEWLRRRDDDPAAPPPSAAVGAAYAELTDALAEPDDQPDALADARVRAAIAAERKAGRGPGAAPSPSSSRARWIGGASVVVAAAAALVIYLARRPRPEPAELEVRAQPGPATRGAADQVHVGDTLLVRARPRGPTELRIYRGPRTVIAHCPGDPGCPGADGPWQLQIEVAAPVEHAVILVFGRVDAPPDATLDQFLAAAHAAGARVTQRTTLVE